MKRNFKLLDSPDHRSGWALSLATALSLLAAAPGAAATVQVEVLDNLFSPSVITIQAGDTVRWVNESGFHNVVANDDSFSSGNPSSGWVYERTFNTPGTIFYYCAPHVIFGMRGEIRVVAAPSSLAAPTGLTAAAVSKSEIRLDWTDRATGEGEYQVERAPLGGDFEAIATLPPGANTYLSLGLAEATFYRFRVRAAAAGGVVSPYSNEAGMATDSAPAPCVASSGTLCVGTGGRFQVQVRWRTASAQGAGTALPIDSAPDSGLFYFFSPANLEMLVKVLDGCGVNQRFWVFYAATTNVELTLTLVDTQTGKTRVYYNPQGQPAAPVQDVDGFATCAAGA